MKARICVVTAGHLATCPRMVKAADALAEHGYDVHVVSTRFLPWAVEADASLRRSRANKWKWTVVAYDHSSKYRRYITALRLRSARWATEKLGVGRSSIQLSGRAFTRAHTELVDAAVVTSCDLFYGGGGALAVAAEAARVTGNPYSLDLEDFHSAETDPDDQDLLRDKIAEHIEYQTLFRARFLTSANEAIAAAYKKKYGIDPVTIHNTFPLPETEPTIEESESSRLKLYWFSQTIGPNRGLEDAVEAMGISALSGELHVRGRPVPGYVDRLRAKAAGVAPKLEVVHHQPAFPDDMVDLCRGYDVGLSPEQGRAFNKSVCLGNKPLTYILAGLPVVLTDTPGHRPLASDLETGSVLYRSGDVTELACALARWAGHRRELLVAKRAAWEAAKRRWHWEHALERGALLHAVEQALN